MAKKFLRKFWSKFNQDDLQALLENTDEDNESQHKKPKTKKGQRKASIDEENVVQSKKKKISRRATIATIDMTLLSKEDIQKVQEMVLYQNLHAVGL